MWAQPNRRCGAICLSEWIGHIGNCASNLCKLTTIFTYSSRCDINLLFWVTKVHSYWHTECQTNLTTSRFGTTKTVHCWHLEEPGEPSPQPSEITSISVNLKIILRWSFTTPQTTPEMHPNAASNFGKKTMRFVTKTTRKSFPHFLIMFLTVLVSYAEAISIECTTCACISAHRPGHPTNHEHQVKLPTTLPTWNPKKRIDLGMSSMEMWMCVSQELGA